MLPAQRNTIQDNTTLNGFNGINSTGPTEAFRPHDNLIQSNTSFGNANLMASAVAAAVKLPVAATFKKH